VERFPQQYAAWKDGCYLYTPVNRKLTAPTFTESLVSFKLRVPCAVSVAVVVGSTGSGWAKLGKHDDDVWEAEVDLSKVWGTGGRVAVCAAYEGSADTYSTLLEYTT